MTQALPSIACFLLSTLLAGVAQGNGRFPRALRLVDAPDDQTFLAVYGTYGLLVSTDAGSSWQHVCEAATGPFSGEGAMLEALPNGLLLLGTDTNLMRSTQGSCDWLPALEPGDMSRVDDISRSPGGDHLYALLTRNDPASGFQISIRRSIDHGQSFAPFAQLPSELIERAFTVDVAPSDPDRLYVSGVSAEGVGVVVRVTGQGQTAEAFEIPLTSAAAAPYLAAIHPTDPNTLFVRTDELALVDNSITAHDRLLFSRDGGETWDLAIERDAKLLGLALSPDGETLLAGYGDPVLFSFNVAGGDVGIYRIELSALPAGADAGASFQKIHDQSTTCLRWTQHALYACFSQEDAGFEVGTVASDEGFTASTLDFAPLLHLPAVRPLACSADSTAAICASDVNNGWPAACSKLGAPCDLLLDASAASPDGAAGNPSDALASANGNCNCRITVGAEDPPRSMLLLFGLLGLLGLFRLRRAHW